MKVKLLRGTHDNFKAGDEFECTERWFECNKNRVEEVKAKPKPKAKPKAKAKPKSKQAK